MIDKRLFTLPAVGMALGLLSMLCALEAFCVLGEAYSLASAITHLWEGGALDNELPLLAAFVACFVGKQVVVFMRATFLEGFAHTRAEELRQKLLERIFTSQVQLVGQAGTGAITSSLLEGVDQVETYLSLILPRLIGVVVIPLVLLIAAFVLDWVSGVILLVLFPMIIFFMILLGRQAQERAEKQFEQYNAMSNNFIDTLRGIETLKVFGKSKAFGKHIYEVSESFREATIATLRVATLSGGVLDLIATLGIAAVAMMLGFRLLSGWIALFPALMVLILAPEYFKPIREFASDFHASLDGKNALAAILDHIGENSEAADVALETWNNSSSLQLEGICFSYVETANPATTDENTPTNADTLTGKSAATDESTLAALCNISTQIEGFTKVGIVGVSGSGKSTLINILGGFAKPQSGTIRINNASLDTLNIPSWRKQLLYIPQDPYIFQASLRDNIAFYAPSASEETIQAAVKTVGLEALVAQLPEGLDTIIGEGGRGLSGGQAQRIAFARALLDPTRKVLLFDEPTAHLDIETELELKERMLPLMENKLVFFATHRLHWLDCMDYILVLENGQIAEAGTLSQLMNAQGKLYELVGRMNKGASA